VVEWAIRVGRALHTESNKHERPLSILCVPNPMGGKSSFGVVAHRINYHKRGGFISMNNQSQMTITRAIEHLMWYKNTQLSFLGKHTELLIA